MKPAAVSASIRPRPTTWSSNLRRAVALQADVGEATEARGLVAGAVEHLGRLDVLVSNVGVIEKAGVLELTEETWDRLFRVNVRGAFFCAQAAARHLAQAGSGRIIFVASTAALMAEPQLAAYAGAKGALLSLTRAMALELAPLRSPSMPWCRGRP